MQDKPKSNLFNTIAPAYAWYYQYQFQHYKSVLHAVWEKLGLSNYNNILDVGCGTGALAAAFNERRYRVTGIDPAKKMLAQAQKRPENQGIDFLQANAHESLPFEDKRFDLSIASYVAHGLSKSERLRMYVEMSRVTRSKVIIFDYNQTRSWTTSFVEWLEHGDYFNFIKDPKSELENCFSSVSIIDVDVRAAWYVCQPLQAESPS